MQTSQNIFSYTLTNGVFVVDRNRMSLFAISLNLLSGVGTFVGTMSAGGTAPSSVALTVGLPVTLSSDSDNLPLDGITIDCSGGGVIQIVGR